MHSGGRQIARLDARGTQSSGLVAGDCVKKNYVVAAMEQLSQFRVQLVKDENFKPWNLALFKVLRREATESIVASQRVAIADYKNSPHRLLFMR